jgi:hypothetical protein
VAETEGKNNEGQENTASSSEPTLEEINAEFQMASPPPPESYTDWRASIKASEGWLQAIAKDERAEKTRNRVQDAPHSQRSWQSRRASYRAREDARRTEHGLRLKARAQLAPQSPNGPYAQGWVDTWWDRVVNRIFGWLGIQ